MTKAQNQKRATLEAEFATPDPQATRKAIEALVLLAAPEPAPLDIFTDEHAAYPRAFKRLPHAITHRTVRSRRCRTALNPLFAVDLLDLLLRHGGSNHKIYGRLSLSYQLKGQQGAR